MNAPLRIDLNDATSFPTRRVEDWKWTDLGRFLRAAPEPTPALAVAPGGPFAAFGGAEIAFGNGRDSAGATEVGYVARGVETLRLRFVSAAEQGGHQARAVIEVEAGADLLLLESYEGSGSAYVANATLDIRLGEGARLTRIVLLDDTAEALSISVATVALAARAELRQVVLTGGARLQRHETRVIHPGEGASVRLDGVYVLSGDRHADLTSVVDHAGPGGQTSQLTKGVVSDRARGVFQGRIVVERGADQTDARMGHHALILGDRAEVDAKPELLIFADDVACAHGNTIGALDQDALFYAMARGVPEPEARAMLTAAFLGAVLDRIEREDVREWANAWLAGRL